MKILWFRRDLRIQDNPLLSFGGEVMPIFIFDTNILNSLQKDDKRVSFIYQKVTQLKKDLQSIGLDLYIFYGDPIEIFNQLLRHKPKEVIASIDYDSYAKKRDKEIEKILPLQRVQDNFIFDHDEILKADSCPYLVFTPYFNKAKEFYTPAHSLKYEQIPHTLFKTKQNMLALKQMGFIQQNIKQSLAQEKLKLFKYKLNAYKKDRDYLYSDGTSNLGVDLRFGTLSIRKVLRFLISCKKEGLQTYDFFRQLVFRDFYAYLLYHFPALQTKDYKNLVDYKFNKVYYEAFITARTGVPVVDAAITQLLTTGTMHNRARMICASFFTKHLLLPWQEGEAFFATHLLDFEKSSNTLSWQWAAGTGIDPQPYFRIFNPYIQSKTYDKNGTYIKRWLPQLKGIEAKNLHNETFLFQNRLSNYPKPIVIHKQARQRAIEAQKR